MAHFLLYTPAGELVTALLASAAVAFVVWWTVALVVSLAALAVWRLWCALHEACVRARRPRRR